ncbi:SDR family NAD(P)-dependent oxidoreductase [Erwinia mallotivora]|uniref:Short-chain dehydrogenase n=1 Tax=Erwinia mallotivora TaxID=69222 RepID=A0A014PZI1_9GAMM|nr:SDR family oxidoreductase [Erwinia mallotivora]EXU76387.1 short-chain dehydrogenase [Erwinia mallotivora]
MSDKIALITGGSRGLGKNAALKLAARGVNIILTWHSFEQQAREVVAQIEALGSRGVALQLDTGNSKTFPGFATEVQQQLKAIWQRDTFDYLLNNAGAGLHQEFITTSEEQFDQMVNVHFKGPFFLTQKLLPLMADGGRILNVSSGLARFSLPGSSAYASVKGAIEVLTRYQAKELGARGITANVLAPGAIETDFSGGMVRDNPQVNAFVSSITALGRPGLPDDIGDAVALLLSDESGWINGQRIEASGGMAL